MSYPNRPQYGQQPHYARNNDQGDFEAAYGNSFAETIPPPARLPSYPQRGGSQPGGYQGHAGSNYPGSNYPMPATNRHVPAPPHSLAPVAMGSARGVMATGPQITQGGIEAPARPSAKAGMSILFAGAIIGGLIGAVMHARQNAAEAFSSATSTHEATADTSGPAPTPPSSAPAPSAKDDANSRLLAGNTDKADKADKADGSKKKKSTIVWHPSKGITTTASNVPLVDKDDDTDPTPAPTTTKGKGKAAKASGKDDDGYTIASAGGDSDSGDSKPTKATDVSKTDKKKGADKAAATANPVEKNDPPPPAKKSPAGKGGDDAVSVLKAAMGATENSL